MWIALGFAALGFLVGNLVALTSESVVSSVVSLLFVFVGGSVLALLHKLNERDRKIAGLSILALSLCCVAGVFTGVTVNEYRLLSPKRVRPPIESALVATPPEKATDQALKSGSSVSPAEPTAFHYLRSADVTPANEIDRLRGRAISAEEAYERMYRLAVGYEQKLRDRRTDENASK